MFQTKMGDTRRSSSLDAQTQPEEKLLSLVPKPSQKVETVPKLDRLGTSSSPRRALTRKTVSEGLLQKSRKNSADHRSSNLSLLSLRRRAISNLETAKELGAVNDKSAVYDYAKPRVDTYTISRLPTNYNVSNLHRLRKTYPPPNSNEQLRPSSRGQEKWAVPRTSSIELSRRKTSSLLQPISSSSISSRSDVDTDSLLGSRSMKSARQIQSSSDVEKYKASAYSSGSTERREIIEKYLKEAKPKVESNSGLKKKIVKTNSQGKANGIADLEGGAQEEKNDIAKDKGGKQGMQTTKKGWGFLRAKLHEVTQLSQKEVQTDPGTIEEEDEQSTEKYLKMLRERLRKCQPADIVASSNVGEITKLKQGIERKRSVTGFNKKGSFFETVLTAHALSKQNKLYSKPLRKASLSKISETSDLFSHDQPRVAYNLKFKSSPHFQKTVKLLSKED